MSRSLQVAGQTGIDLSKLRIAAPCDAEWDQMRGDDQKRFCDACALDVYNFAGMRETEIHALLADAEGRVCAQLWKRHDGTVITSDCPVGLAERAWRASRNSALTIAAATLTLLTFLFGAVVWFAVARDKVESYRDQPLGGAIAMPLGGIEAPPPPPVMVKGELNVVE